MTLKREGAWVIACAAVATAFCLYAPDYGFSPVPFFTAVLYVVAWGGRLLVRHGF